MEGSGGGFGNGLPGVRGPEGRQVSTECWSKYFCVLCKTMFIMSFMLFPPWLKSLNAVETISWKHVSVETICHVFFPRVYISHFFEYLKEMFWHILVRSCRKTNSSIQITKDDIFFWFQGSPGLPGLPVSNIFFPVIRHDLIVFALFTSSCVFLPNFKANWYFKSVEIDRQAWGTHTWDWHLVSGADATL